MGRTLGIMLTMTTYGTWLRGDQRGWVDEGRILPPDPDLHAADAVRMKHSVYLFPTEMQVRVGEFIGTALIEKLQMTLWALTVQSWHVHAVVAPTEHDVPDIIKRIKDTVRRGLKESRPIWTDGYDKRFCFDEASVWNRIRYVERHNQERGISAQPWSFITTPFSPRLSSTGGDNASTSTPRG